ncbi:hypothetical protein [Prevotella brunnea]
MKYSVKCNNCNEVFMAETDKYGQQKYRCPYCGNVVTCQFNEPEVFRTKARSIIPIIDADEVAPTERQIPVATTVLSHSSSAQATGDERDADHSTDSISRHRDVTEKIPMFFNHSTSRLKRFQDKYADGDLWIFFGFSFLFVLLVILSLFVMSQVVSGLVDGQSWLFEKYIKLRNML